MSKLVVDNRKARFEYELLEKHEAGIVLVGSEVKSLRDGKVNLTAAWCQVEQGEMFLHGAEIQPYSHGNRFNADPTRKRKLLLKREEIRKLHQKVKERGLTIVPTKIYFTRGIAKVEIALAKGKKLHDKRDAIKKRDQDRERRRGDES
ncbi:MAG: SsrA-binding protein SmpB [Deltaproteobacteria bacterium]|nr:SsrA-binding protein SmpB [Deltaproteobacteria bacterium]